MLDVRNLRGADVYTDHHLDVRQLVGNIPASVRTSSGFCGKREEGVVFRHLDIHIGATRPENIWYKHQLDKREIIHIDKNVLDKKVSKGQGTIQEDC